MTLFANTSIRHMSVIDGSLYTFSGNFINDEVFTCRFDTLRFHHEEKCDNCCKNTVIMNFLVKSIKKTSNLYIPYQAFA